MKAFGGKGHLFVFEFIIIILFIIIIVVSKIKSKIMIKSKIVKQGHYFVQALNNWQVTEY